MDLGTRIKQLRIEKKMKQSDLALKADISRVAVGNYERNDRTPSTEILMRIADALDTTLWYLLGLDDISNPYDILGVANSNKIPPWEMIGLSISEFLNEIKEPDKLVFYQIKFGEDLLSKYIGVAEALVNQKSIHVIEETELENKLVDYFYKLNRKGREKAIESIELLTKIQEFTQKLE